MTKETLLRLVPPIARARDFRLYTQDGRRLVDLWQQNGAAILGHTPPGLLRAFKNSAERGLFAPLPHPQEQRFLKALAALLPGLSFRLYRSDAALREALNVAGLPDPMIWRPFLDSTLPHDQSIVPILPLPWPDAPQVLALPPALEAAAALPGSDLISPVTLAAATRSVYDLIAATPARGRVRYPRIEAALAKSAANGAWRQRGIYLYCNPALDDEAYAKTFTHFLEQGFLLPPMRDQPLILPGILSPGEEAKLAGLLGRADP
jgi:hypothetical protein